MAKKEVEIDASALGGTHGTIYVTVSHQITAEELIKFALGVSGTAEESSQYQLWLVTDEGTRKACETHDDSTTARADIIVRIKFPVVMSQIVKHSPTMVFSPSTLLTRPQGQK